MLTIITNAPIWVWCILLVLTFLGYQQTRTGDIKLIRMLIAPLISSLLFMRILAVYTDSLANMAIVMLGLLFGVGLGFARWYDSPPFSYQQKSQVWQRNGSFIPLCAYVYIFILRYIATALAYAPELIPQYVAQYFPAVLHRHIDILIADITLVLDSLTAIGVGVLVSMVLVVLVAFMRKQTSPLNKDH